MTGETADTQTRSPRALFAQRFTELYEAAGNPTLRRVANAAEARMRAAQGTRPGGASAQRISDWKAGRNVPARFESLLPVVLTLIDLTRKSGTQLPRLLSDPKEWQRLWRSATTWNPEADDEAACPYLGLTPYRHENRDLFFGRTRATTELTALVRAATGVVAVIGASGAGKSSLLAAGLTPALADWEVTALTPGTHPLDALLAATTPAAPESSAPDADALAPRADGPRRLLIIDQFEELFTTCRDENEREAFLTALDDYATRTDDPISVVIALRADFYAHCLNYLILQTALEQHSFLLGPMRMDELAQAISGPARAAGLELEPGLEELVITELCGAGDHHGRRSYDPGALPLLSHVMAATWQHREGRKLTVTGYRKSGGVVGSVTETAEYAWNELTDPQRHAAKAILLGLVAVSQDSQDTRRPAQRPDLLHRATNPEDATAALELLSRTRLITLDSESVTLTHEIVLTAWPRLRNWIDEDRVGYLVRQRLESDAAEWAAQERDPSLLYRGTRLQNAEDNAEPPPVGELARAFLTASTKARTQTRRRSTRFKSALALLGVVLLVLGFAVYTQNRLASQQRDDKNFAAVMAAADRLVSKDPSVAAQLYLIAHRLHPDDTEVRTRLLQTQNLPLMTLTPANKEKITEIQYRPSGDVLATVTAGGDDYFLRLWDATDPQHPRQLGREIADVRNVAFSPDSKLMITSSYSHDPQLWDVTTPAEPRRVGTLPPIGGNRSVHAVFVGDGRTVAAYSPIHLTLWNISDPAAPIPGPAMPLQSTRDPATPITVGGESLAYSPTGQILATGSLFDRTGTVQLWDVGSQAMPVRIGEFQPTTAGVGQLAFSPDGTILAVVGDIPKSGTDTVESTLRLWNITDRAHPRPVATITDSDNKGVYGLAFSPDGQTLATSGSQAGSFWNVTDPAQPARIPNHLSTGESTCQYNGVSDTCDYTFQAVAFAPDGRTLAAGDLAGDIQIWSPPPARLTGHAATVSDAVFDAAGDMMVTSDIDGLIVVWDVRTPAAPKRIGDYQLPHGYYSMSLAPDGRTLLATNSLPSAVSQLDLSDPAHIGPPITWPLSADEQFEKVAISPDWRRAVVLQGGYPQLWDLSEHGNPSPIAPRTSTSPHFETVDFDATGRTLLLSRHSLAGDFIVARWDISDPLHPRQLDDLFRQPSHSGDSLAFTPDHRTLVVLNSDSLQSWDISNPERPVRLGDPVMEHPGTGLSVDFTANARTMVTSAVGGTVQLWDFTNPAKPQRIGGSLSGSGNTMRTRFHPSGRYLAATAVGGSLLLWDLDEQHAITRICAVTGTMWTPELWQYYLPQLPYNPPCD
ncbi:WD40 repeat domain-containing protein [Nocardia sp. NPDC051030]|uniref:WD40 repeat domain-containing protein n=1 Tax=Nocardia sp. NPDC051030 TaxID=3155162 RepID=UPI0034338490